MTESDNDEQTKRGSDSQRGTNDCSFFRSLYLGKVCVLFMEAEHCKGCFETLGAAVLWRARVLRAAGPATAGECFPSINC